MSDTQRIRRALEAAYPNEGDVAIIRALVDLRHLCDDAELIFVALDREAHNIYLREKEPQWAVERAREN